MPRCRVESGHAPQELPLWLCVLPLQPRRPAYGRKGQLIPGATNRRRAWTTIVERADLPRSVRSSRSRDGP